MSNSLFQSSMAYRKVWIYWVPLRRVRRVEHVCTNPSPDEAATVCVCVKRGERSRETGQIHCFCSGGAAGLLSNDPLENESDPPDDGGFGLIEGGGGGGGGSEASNGVPGSCAWT